MNKFDNGSPEEEYANWEAPKDNIDNTQEIIEFKPFDFPETPEGGDAVMTESENGDKKTHIITDEKGREIYHHETTEQSDWQKKLSYDNQGRIAGVENQKLTPGKESHTKDTFAYDEQGQATKKGRIESGQDAGHEYKELPIVEKNLGDGKVIKIITTEILKQGNNGSSTKAKDGTTFTKTVYMKDGQWQGEKVIGTDGSETTQFPKGIEELPSWE